MQSSQEQDQRLQALYQTIDTQYLENAVPFVPHSSPQPKYRTSSTILHVNQWSYHHFLKQTKDGHVAVPVSQTIWVSIRPIQNIKNLDITQDQSVRVLKLPQKSEKSGEILCQLAERKDDGEQRYQLVYEVMKDNNSSRFVPFFGIIMEDEAFQMKDGEDYTEIVIPLVSSLKGDAMEPILVSYRNLMYLRGFKNKIHRLIFDSQLKNKLNCCFSKVQGILNLGGQNIGNEGLRYISKNHSSQIISLNLWWNMLGQQGAKILSQGYYPQLKFLDLRKNFIGDAGLMHFKPDEQQSFLNLLRRSFPNTQKLVLSDNNLSSVLPISKLIFPSLKELQLQNNKITLNSPFDIQIPPLNTLKILSLRNNQVTGLGLGTLELASLEELYLSNNCIVSCQPLAGAYLPQLRVLCLDKNKICSVKWVKKCVFTYGEGKGLRILDINDNQIMEIGSLGRIDWRELRQLHLNSSKKSSIIKQYDRVSMVNDLCKWSMNGATHPRKFQLNTKRFCLNLKKITQVLTKCLQPASTIII